MPRFHQINGKHVPFTPEEEAARDAEEAAWEAATPARAEKKVIEARMREYGPPEKQIEFITENGLEAWQQKVSAIKIKYPKLGD